MGAADVYLHVLRQDRPAAALYRRGGYKQGADEYSVAAMEVILALSTESSLPATHVTFDSNLLRARSRGPETNLHKVMTVISRSRPARLVLLSHSLNFGVAARTPPPPMSILQPTVAAAPGALA